MRYPHVVVSSLNHTNQTNRNPSRDCDVNELDQSDAAPYDDVLGPVLLCVHYSPTLTEGFKNIFVESLTLTEGFKNIFVESPTLTEGFRNFSE